MDKDKLIAKQQLEIEELKEKIELLNDGVASVFNELYCIGGPLNDNVLMYSKQQLMPFIRIKNHLNL